MRKFYLSLFAFCLLGFAFAEDWQEASGEHFIVYFSRDEKLAKDVLNKAEDYYRDIASQLGYARYSGFWTWDKRVKIFIYSDRSSFLKATNQPDWSEGMADYTNKRIISFAWSSGFLESLLPHEMAHLIFRDFVGFPAGGNGIPLWLDEGVAQWAEKLKRGEIKKMAKELFDSDGLLAVDDMMKLDIRVIKNMDTIYRRPNRTKSGKNGLLILNANSLVNTYYLEAVSLVGFLIEKYGSDRFGEFCRQLRDGKSVEEALRFSYSMYIRSIQELEDRWREYLSKN